MNPYIEKNINTALTATFKNGKSNISIDMVKFFPATAKDFKTLLTMIEDRDTAEKIYNFLNAAIEITTAERSRYNDRETKEKASCTSFIKRYIVNLDILAEQFGFTSVSDAEISKLKKINIYTRVSENGRAKAEMKSGWTFTKYGMTFTAYKKAPKQYVILVPSFGLEAATATSQKEITTVITQDLCDKLNEIITKDSQAGENSAMIMFSRMIEAAGYELNDLHKPIQTAVKPHTVPEQTTPIETTTEPITAPAEPIESPTEITVKSRGTRRGYEYFISPNNASKAAHFLNSEKPTSNYGYTESAIITAKNPRVKYTYRIDRIDNIYVCTVRHKEAGSLIAIVTFEDYTPESISFVSADLYRNCSNYPYRRELSAKYLKKYDTIACIVHGAITAGLLYDMNEPEAPAETAHKPQEWQTEAQPIQTTTPAIKAPERTMQKAIRFYRSLTGTPQKIIRKTEKSFYNHSNVCYTYKRSTPPPGETPKNHDTRHKPDFINTS
jgi:hypothetical protein